MKIALITDIHCARRGEPGPDARTLVGQFVDFAIQQQADLLVDLGDRIDDVDPHSDLATSTELAQIFSRFPGRRVHLLGNHDVVNLTPGDHLDTFGQPSGHRIVEAGAFRFVVWEPSVRFSRRAGFPPAEPDLAWLVGTLSSDERPAIIVSHIPVSGAAMTGNYYFANNADFATYPDHADICRAVAQTGRAAMWISGHVHWNSITNIGNSYHLTLQSASETFTTGGDPADAFALLEVDAGTARLQVFGRDPLVAELPFRLPSPWPEPRPKVSRS